MNINNDRAQEAPTSQSNNSNKLIWGGGGLELAENEVRAALHNATKAGTEDLTPENFKLALATTLISGRFYNKTKALSLPEQTQLATEIAKKMPNTPLPSNLQNALDQGNLKLVTSLTDPIIEQAIKTVTTRAKANPIVSELGTYALKLNNAAILALGPYETSEASLQALMSKGEPFFLPVCLVEAAVQQGGTTEVDFDASFGGLTKTQDINFQTDNEEITLSYKLSNTIDKGAIVTLTITATKTATPRTFPIYVYNGEEDLGNIGTVVVGAKAAPPDRSGTKRERVSKVTPPPQETPPPPRKAAPCPPTDPTCGGL